MNDRSRDTLRTLIMILALTIGLLLPMQVSAHCDSLDGPVITEARTALGKGDVTPVLKWVKPDDEHAIRTVFEKTLAVRKLAPDAQELADLYFFETLVRIHRAGEGAPYTGLKTGAVDPVIAKADQALTTGSVDSLVKAILAHTEEGIRERFNHALDKRSHANQSVAAGRDYVAAYVTFVHYVEGIARVVHAAPHHDEEAKLPAHHH